MLNFNMMEIPIIRIVEQDGVCTKVELAAVSRTSLIVDGVQGHAGGYGESEAVRFLGGTKVTASGDAGFLWKLVQLNSWNYWRKILFIHNVLGAHDGIRI